MTIEGPPAIVQFIANKYSNTVLGQDVVYVGGAGANPTVEELIKNAENSAQPQAPETPNPGRPLKRKHRSPTPDRTATPQRRKPKRQSLPRDRPCRVLTNDRRRPLTRKRPSPPAGDRKKKPAAKKPSLKERLEAAERELARDNRDVDTGDEREQGERAEPFLDYSLLDEED